MLVDDNDTDNFISKRIIEITKFAKRVEVKGSGKAALDYLRENQNNAENLPSLIFLDINMPIVDGFVFLYEFEKFNEIVRNKCKVIILSSSDNKRDIDKIVNVSKLSFGALWLAADDPGKLAWDGIVPSTLWWVTPRR